MVDDSNVQSGGFRGCCIGSASVLVLFAGMVAYAVFTLLFLIQTKDICGRQSPLWTFVLLSIINSCLVLRLTRGERAEETPPKPIKKIMCSMISPLFNVIYGSVVIHGGKVCSEMKHTGLWVIANMIYYSSLIVTFFLLLALCNAVCCTPRPPSESEQGFRGLTAQIEALQLIIDAETNTEQETEHDIGALTAQIAALQLRLGVRAETVEATLPEAEAVRTGSYRAFATSAVPVTAEDIELGRREGRQAVVVEAHPV
jgi:hypothetical protein